MVLICQEIWCCQWAFSWFPRCCTLWIDPSFALGMIQGDSWHNWPFVMLELVLFLRLFYGYKNAGMREEHVQWPSSQKAAILVLLITGTGTRQQHTNMFPLTWITYKILMSLVIDIFFMCGLQTWCEKVSCCSSDFWDSMSIYFITLKSVSFVSLKFAIAMKMISII